MSHVLCVKTLMQVTPVLLTAPLLERFKDNYIIVEVWDRRVGASGDKVSEALMLCLKSSHCQAMESDKREKSLISVSFCKTFFVNRI